MKEQRLEELQPEQVFMQCYENKFDKTAPTEMLTLFNELHESLQGAD